MEKVDIVMNNMNLVSGPYDCHQTAMANIVKYYGYDHYAVAIGKISFEYYGDNDMLIGDKIKCQYMRKGVDYCGVLGIECEKYDMDEESVQKLNKFLEKGIPILVWTDLYECCWNDAYKKYHFLHCYIIYEKNENMEFCCIDPYFKKKNIKQTVDEFEKMAKGYDVYYKNRLNNNSDYYRRISIEMKKDASFYLDNMMYDSIAKFMNELTSVDIKEECGYPDVDIYAIPLFDKLKIVGDQRAAYATLIRNMMDVKQNFWLDIAVELELSAQLWSKIRMYLMKKVMTGSNNLDATIIKSNLNQIIELEKKCFTKMLNM